jgi:cGMP-dependent protein kinase
MGICSPKSKDLVNDTIVKVQPLTDSVNNSVPIHSETLSRSGRPLLRIKTIRTEKTHEAETARISNREKTDLERQMIRRSLASQFIFSSLSNECLNSLIGKMRLYTLEPKNEVFTQGKLGDNFFVVASGRLEVRVDGVVTGSLMKGQSFGEMALVHDIPRPCTVITSTFSNLWGLTRDDFRSSTHSANDKKYQEIKVFISSIPLFDMLIASQKEKLVELLIPQDFEDGDVIVSEGDPGDLLFIIQKGLVRCTVKGQFIRDMSKGDFFGEQALLYGTKRTATITAVKKVSTLSLHREHITKVLGNQLQQIIYKNTLRISIEKSETLKKLSKKQIESIINSIKITSYPPGHKIIEKGSIRGNRFFILVKGHLLFQGKIINFGNTIGDQDLMKMPGGKFLDAFVCEDDCDVAEISRVEIEKIIGGSLKNVIEKNLILGILKQVQLFRTLPVQKLETLIGILINKEVLKGQFIFHQGDPGNDFFIIKDGEVEIIKDGIVIRVQEKNDFFGERAILFKENRTASARAKEKVELWVLNKDEFLRVIDTGMRDQLIKRIQLQDDKLSMDDIKILRKLGNGSFGNVFLGLNTSTQTLYAIKGVSRKVIFKYELEELMKLERKVLLQVDHPFIVKLVKTLKDQDRIYYILEYIRGTGLFETLRILDLLRIEDIKFYVACIVLMLEHLHERNIIYRDLKPENLMIDEDGYLKLIDFGTAKIIEGKTFTLIGTPQYLAPEVILGKGYSLTADLWSLGIITFELGTGKVPFGENEQDPYKIYEQILESDVEYPQILKAYPKIKLFCVHLLNKNPAQRGTAESIKIDKVFAGFNWEGLIGKHLKPPYMPIINSFLMESSRSEFRDACIKDIFDFEENRNPCDGVGKRTTDYDQNWDKDF